MRLRTALWMAIGLMAANLANGAQASSRQQELSPVEYDRLRHRLETLFNEQDLLIKNQKVDKSDVRHQLREFEELKVFERIPFKADIPGLQKDLNETAKERGLAIQEFKLLPQPKKHLKSIPDSIYTDDPSFELSINQIVDMIPFRLVVRGEEPAIHAWIESWKTELLRLIETQDQSIPKAIHRLGNQSWEIQAHAFRFRELKFPALKARDPVAILPRWAAQNPGKFAQAQPLLWNIVTRTHQIAPEARPLYRNREELLLNDARMSFFIAHATPHSDGSQHTGKNGKPAH